MVKLLLADDHDLVRETLSEFMSREAGFEVIQAKNLTDALEMNRQHGSFDLVILDYTMPGMDALGGLQAMREKCGCPVAILSGTAPPHVARRALRSGAAGFIPKTLAPQALVDAVTKMLKGETFLPIDFLTEENTGETMVNLTPRERDVLLGVTEGKLNKEIARDLDIQEVTVKLHVKTLSRKLRAKNRTHAAMLGRDMGLI
ncbi:MAG: response regulator transcription factor [Pseudomonadota bacterium]